ncbi:MAG: hypothetical protein ACM357_05515 [Gemmatimonadota bacterium]
MPLRRLALAALALFALTSVASAQEGGPPQTRRPMNLLALEGPPEPAVFARAVGLDADQATKYGHLRSAYLKATKAERDSLLGMRARMRAERGTAGRPGATERRDAPRRTGGMQAMRPLIDTLESRFADFEGDLAFLLSAEQQKKYEAWKAGELERRRSEMMQRRQ